MLLFKKPFWAGLVSGDITLTFRRWQKPHVRAGGRYRCHPIGVLEVSAVGLVTVASITEEEAKRSGFSSRRELVDHLAALGPLDERTEVYRVVLHHGGDGDRVELALETALSDEDVAKIRATLARFDRPAKGRKKPWTAEALALIDAHPRVAASKLAAIVGRPTVDFKVDVRRLKKLGLTQSFEIGYEIAPRGRAYLARVPLSARSRASQVSQNAQKQGTKRASKGAAERSSKRRASKRDQARRA